MIHLLVSHGGEDADDKKQGSSGEVSISNSMISTLAKHTVWCNKAYKQLLEEGVAPEQARMVLPQSTMTEWYWSGSLTLGQICVDCDRVMTHRKRHV